MTENSDTLLFQLFTLGSLPLKNRVVMAPLTRSRSSDAGVPPDYAATVTAQVSQRGQAMRRSSIKRSG